MFIPRWSGCPFYTVSCKSEGVYNRTYSLVNFGCRRMNSYRKMNSCHSFSGRRYLHEQLLEIKRVLWHSFILWRFILWQYWVIVVYFDQQVHACACVHMVENNEKHLKIMKNMFSIVFDHAFAGRNTQQAISKVLEYKNFSCQSCLCR